MTDRSEAGRPHDKRPFDPSEVGALAHLYRGEVYRSTIWRTRLDHTTNWAIVTMGIALSTSFSSRDASAIPLLLVGFLLAVFITLEARRYRYFNVWRARARWMEKHFFARMLAGEPADERSGWRDVLANDYAAPLHHISFARALGRRLRRNYIWILGLQALAYFGKIAVHPTPAAGWADIAQRAAVGPVPGELVLTAGGVYYGCWISFALVTLWLDRQRHGERRKADAMG